MKITSAYVFQSSSPSRNWVRVLENCNDFKMFIQNFCQMQNFWLKINFHYLMGKLWAKQKEIFVGAEFASENFWQLGPLETYGRVEQGSRILVGVERRCSQAPPLKEKFGLVFHSPLQIYCKWHISVLIAEIPQLAHLPPLPNHKIRPLS